MKPDQTFQGSVLTANLFNQIAIALLPSSISLPGSVLSDKDFNASSQTWSLYSARDARPQLDYRARYQGQREAHVQYKGRDPPEPSWLQRFPRQTGFAATESEVSSLLGGTTLPFEEGAHCPGRATLGQALSAARYWRAHALLQFKLINKRVEFGDRPYCKSKLPISSVDIWWHIETRPK